MQAQNRMDTERKAIIWHEWRKGSPMSVICRIIEKPSATVFSYLRYHGGIEPRIRVRRLSSLSIGERECSGSTISREIERNGGPRRYRAADADLAACKRALRPKICLLAGNDKLRKLVAEKLSEDWSPEQIAGWLKLNS